MFSVHKEYDILAIPFSSQARGFFARLQKQQVDSFFTPRVLKKNNYYTPSNLRLFKYLRALSLDLNMTISELVLAYMFSQPIPVVPVFASRTLHQLTESLQASTRHLSAEIMTKICTIKDQD